MRDFVPNDDGRRPSAEELRVAACALTPEIQEKVMDVIDNLYRGIGDKDCWCRDIRELEDQPKYKCEACVARQAIDDLMHIAYPVVRSLREDRLNYAEAVYFEEWVKQNTKRPGVNSGLALLEAILSTKETGGVFKTPIPVTVSQRDMDVATAVVQWLGTNCGMGFRLTCEREAERRRCIRSNFDYALARTVDEPTKPSEREHDDVARCIAERYVTTEEYRKKLKADILRAMKLAELGKTMKELAGELYYREPNNVDESGTTNTKQEDGTSVQTPAD